MLQREILNLKNVVETWRLFCGHLRSQRLSCCIRGHSVQFDANCQDRERTPLDLPPEYNAVELPTHSELLTFGCSTRKAMLVSLLLGPSRPILPKSHQVTKCTS